MRAWLVAFCPVARALRAARHRAVSTTTFHGGLEEVADRYDTFLLDQYGVLHNGGALFPAAAAALGELAARGKTMVVVSNTSKRRAELVGELPARGFRRDWLAGAVCSGEACWEALRDGAEARAVVLGWEGRGAGAYLAGTGVSLAAGVADADVVVAYGPETVATAGGAVATGFARSGDLGPYAALLREAAARGLPMRCANPDQVSVAADGETALSMPGKLADAYRALGGAVAEYGKPHAAHFAAAMAVAAADPARTVHVGDSLRHDVAGAAAAGVDSIFVVEDGIHGAALAADADWAAGRRRAALARLAGDGPAPTRVLRRFAWPGGG